MGEKTLVPAPGHKVLIHAVHSSLELLVTRCHKNCPMLHATVKSIDIELSFDETPEEDETIQEILARLSRLAVGYITQATAQQLAELKSQKGFHVN